MPDIILHWKGPGFYCRSKDNITAHLISTTNNWREAEALATLAGLNAKSVAHLSEKPDSSEFVSVYDETEPK